MGENGPERRSLVPVSLRVAKPDSTLLVRCSWRTMSGQTMHYQE